MEVEVPSGAVVLVAVAEIHSARIPPTKNVCYISGTFRNQLTQPFNLGSWRMRERRDSRPLLSSEPDGSREQSPGSGRGTTRRRGLRRRSSGDSSGCRNKPSLTDSVSSAQSSREHSPKGKSTQKYWKFLQNTVFENHRVSLIQHCERSELRSQFEWTKVN